MNILHLNQDFYNELAQELVTLIYDEENSEGVVELKILIAKGKYADIIFAFSAADFSIEKGLESICYLIIALDGQKRCATDFEPQKLSPLIDF